MFSRKIFAIKFFPSNCSEILVFLQTRNRQRIHLKDYLVVNEERNPQTESAILSMKFKVRRHFVKDGMMRVTCVASIMGAYQRNRTVDMFVRTPEHLSRSNGGNNLISIFGSRRASDASASIGNTLAIFFPCLLATFHIMAAPDRTVWSA